MNKNSILRLAFTAPLLLAFQASHGAHVAHDWARGIEGQRKADLGNGTYLNPIFPGDHPDPSILKDGSDYYIVFSTFEHYPGLVLSHSAVVAQAGGNWRSSVHQTQKRPPHRDDSHQC